LAAKRRTPRWRGQLDHASRLRLRGWAQDEADPEKPVRLVITDNGVVLARVLANANRDDLRESGFGSGRHGFEFLIPRGLSPLEPHVIDIRRAADGVSIGNCPWTIPEAAEFDADLEAAVVGAIGTLGETSERRRVTVFMLTQLDRLRQLQAEAEGKRAERLAFRELRRRLGPEAERTRPIHDPGLRALVIDGRVPITGRDAGSQAILSHMRALRQLGCTVSFVAAEDWAPDEVSAALDEAGFLYCGPPVYGPVEDVLRRQAGCFDVVYLHRASVATRYLALARHYMPRARILYSIADLHYLRLERQAAIEERPELLAESRRVRLAECTAAWSADAVLTHSEAEAALLRQLVPEARVHLAGWEVPIRRNRTGFAERQGVAFIGHYGHAPNRDAAHWLAEAVMPLVWQVDPDIYCLLVGSAMPREIWSLTRPGLVAVGAIQDLGPMILDRVRLTVAPLRFGAGIKGKVLESFAAGLPCVMSKTAAEGLPLCARLSTLVGHDAAALAALIIHMHSDEAANKAAARAGQALIRKRFSAAATVSALQAALKLAPLGDRDAA
jgi:glycosyltransferase involved in cell wall biosynthesis